MLVKRQDWFAFFFFDKPPGAGWSLTLHRDKTIAVARHVNPMGPFKNPTRKSNVCHVVAPIELLQSMLTLRLHLDAMHAGNGPLIVVPGSHKSEEEATQSSVQIHCQQGDVFAMRPLLSHGSLATEEGNQDHRRVVHLEFAPSPDLPAGFEWYQFDALR